MKKVIISLSIIGVVGAIVIGATVAVFNDTETSTGNIFTAGSIDLKVDHTLATYNGGKCISDCQEIGSELVINGGFETPALANGTWNIYGDGTQTSWNVESGAGLEIQNHAAGDPHGGNQLAELDSNNSSVVSQMIPTVAGKQYRLTLWFSPRPNVQANDNQIGVNIKVTSGTNQVINDVIGTGVSGGSTTSWTKYTYNFIATDSNTKIIFSDLGTSNNSYGGYLDDISVKELNCNSSFPNGGICTLWNEKDLGQGDTFWNFDDIKPGDYGTNVISLRTRSNDAFACLIVHDETNEENTRLNPETLAGDTTPGPGPASGELSQFINIFAWSDDNDGIYETGETTLYQGPIDTELIQLSLSGAGPTSYVGLAWCAGTQSIIGNTISCDGASMGNIAQTDQFTASLTAYAEQQRNNPNFSCAHVILP